MIVRKHLLKTRFGFCCCTFFLLFAVILGRLFYLQIILNDILYILGRKNFLRLEKIISPRGNIVDSHGRMLATNRPIVSLYWTGSGKKLDEEKYQTVALLETIVGTPLLEDIISYEKKGKTVLLVKELSFEQLSKISEQFPHHKNITIATHFKRYYPYHSYSSHVIGHLSMLDSQLAGKMGLELLLDENLKGTPGEKIKTVNSQGNHIAEEEVKKAFAGETIKTTIDINLQHIAESIFPQDFAGVLLLMDPQTGALEVVLSRPSFDPNTFLNPIKEHDWARLQANNPFLNRALNTYPPASLFKLVTIAAALEHNIVKEDSVWNCRGHITFGGRVYHCSNLSGHGELTFEEALAQSCNIPFFEIGKHIKIDQLAEQARKFGLGQKTNVLFHEKTGLIPTSTWKRMTFNERWYPGETLSAVIGQSYMLVTPLQIARMISGICQGYLVKPRILSEEGQEKEHFEVSETTRTFLKRSMKRTITDGSGRRLKNLHNMEIFAKTGTAQNVSLEKRELGKHFLEHAWFVAHVTYKDYEPKTIVILIEHAGSSRVATSIAWSFLVNYCQYLDHGTTFLETDVPSK